MKRFALVAAATLSCISGVAVASEQPAPGAMSQGQLQLSANAIRDYCLSCKGEKPANGRFTCWDAKGLELPVRIRGDFLCASNYGNPIYQIGEGKCATKKYCKTIK
ncbi:MAG: hypothetical protein H6877_01510 [Rhodobiaceae bacterium]|nr:hypothetical protein [Rhodobiaceae bacterium]MCC0061108.1 hypothetical protein [Rhodobiaceae bacterium]